MNRTFDEFDRLVASSLKRSERPFVADERFVERLVSVTRPEARARRRLRRGVVAVSVALLALGSFGMWTGVLPVPAFLASTAVSPAAEPTHVVEKGEVAVPVRPSAAPRVVRAARPQDSDEVDRSIVNAFEYFLAQQKPNGSFPGNYGDSTAIPALVGMAFLSRGTRPDDARYGAAFLKCVDFVLGAAEMRDDQQFKGYLGRPGNGRMYAHSIATLFLSECSGMLDEERQKKIDAILPYAVKVIVDAQNQQKDANQLGGWRYEPNSRDSDLSCSGWALMALKSARLNGAPVPDEAIEKAVLYIRRAHRESDGTFGYQGANGGNAEMLSGAAILCLELCGRHLEPESLRAAKYLEKVYPKALKGGGYRFYGLYYTAQGLFQIGGEIWKAFEPWMYETFLKEQKPDGSWPTDGTGNAVYSTAMTVLAFTVPYRMLPIYQRDETVDE